MRYFYAILLSLLFTFDVQAQGLTNVGYAPFNLTSPNFNCKAFKKSTKSLSELHIAFLYNTFGNDFSCLKDLLNDERLKTLEIHLINEPGHRNNRLGKYEFLRKVGSVRKYDKLMRNNNQRLKVKYTNYTKKLRNFLSDNLKNHTELIISPGLESNLSSKGAKNLINWTRELFPDTRIVWNPVVPHPKKRSSTKADFIEGHNFSPRINEPCIYNLDGTDVSYPNRPALGELQHKEGESKNWVQSGRPLRQLLETYANVCEIVFVWTAESNGLDYKSKRFVDPRRRNHKIPLKMYKIIMKDIKRMHKNGKIYPKSSNYNESELQVENSCDVVRTNFTDGKKSGNLLKQSEFRDRGAVLLLPYKNSISNVRLIHANSIVDRYTKLGTYKDGRLLFRSNKSPIEYPFNTYLKYNDGKKKICYKIKNPRIRLD